MMRNGEISGRSDPPRVRPCNACDQHRYYGEQESGSRAASCPRARQLRTAAWLQGSLREMPDRLTAQGVSRLNAKRVERPEIRFRDAKQGPPSEPPRGDDDE